LIFLPFTFFLISFLSGHLNFSPITFLPFTVLPITFSPVTVLPLCLSWFKETRGLHNVQRARAPTNIKEMVSAKVINIEYGPIVKMVIDMLTKAIFREKHMACMEILGLQPSKD
jgi:hypothetical protein